MRGREGSKLFLHRMKGGQVKRRKKKFQKNFQKKENNQITMRQRPRKGGERQGVARSSGDRDVDEDAARSWVSELGDVVGRGLLVGLVLLAFSYGPEAARVVFHLKFGLGERPAISDQQARPILVVGSMSSGTTQMTAQLNELGVEVAHENSDASRTFCRDGSVSWIHGMRFLARNAGIDLLQRAKQLCAVQRPKIFTPLQFSGSDCSFASQFLWTACWQRSCERQFIENLGCQLGKDSACETKFEHTVVLTRFPLNIINSLVARWCHVLDDTIIKAPKRVAWDPTHGLIDRFHPGHLYPGMRALFPPGGESTPDEMWKTESCSVWLSWYVVAYYERILDANLDAPIIRVEESNAPCKIALHGGFSSLSKCQGVRISPSSAPRDKLKNPKRHGTINALSKRASLSWEHIKDSSPALYERLVALTDRLGYQG